MKKSKMSKRRQKGFYFFWKLITLIAFFPLGALLPANVLGESIPSETSHGRHDVFNGVEGCPLEHFKALKAMDPISGKEKAEPSNVGETVTYVCDYPAGMYDFLIDNYGNQFVTYPNPNRTCQPDGTWSGTPPICVYTTEIENGKHLTVQPLTPVHCTNRTCNQAQIGHLTSSQYSNKSRQTLGNDLEDLEIQQVRFELPEIKHVSFMTFKFPAEEYFIVEVRVDRDSVVSSADWSDFHKAYYDSVVKVNEELSNSERGAVEIAAYTRHIYVKFIKMKSENYNSQIYNPQNYKFEWIPQPEFYVVPDYNTTQFGNPINFGCPKGPTIMHGIVVNGSLTGKFVVYECPPGYTLFDPVRNKSSNGLIRCRNALWEPYPYPICRKNPEQSKSPTITLQYQTTLSLMNNASDGVWSLRPSQSVLKTNSLFLPTSKENLIPLATGKTNQASTPSRLFSSYKPIVQSIILLIIIVGISVFLFYLAAKSTPASPVVPV